MLRILTVCVCIRDGAVSWQAVDIVVHEATNLSTQEAFMMSTVVGIRGLMSRQTSNFT